MKAILYAILIATLAISTVNAATPISSCGTYGAGDYYLTKDITTYPINNQQSCLKFEDTRVLGEAKSITIDCNNYQIENSNSFHLFYPTAIYATNINTLDIKNCKAKATTAILVEGYPPANSLVTIQNSQLNGYYIGFEGYNLAEGSKIINSQLIGTQEAPVELYNSKLKITDSNLDLNKVLIYDSISQSRLDVGYSINVNFVDAVTNQPIKTTVMKITDAKGKTTTANANSNGVIKTDHFNIASLFAERGKNTLYNPFKVEITAPCYKPITNNNYVLSGPVLWTHKMVKTC
ncbi:hypothetical protein HUU53_04055 [Candidatus Micrarchaeota archaeon]|nr:hypothetical protein [Candidatus Micrarchaeota archaeon]